MKNNIPDTIGNDIVCYDDISDSSSFFNKISPLKEREIISVLIENPNINAIVFSIKEAAYKNIIKRNFNMAFSPSLYVIEQIAETRLTKSKSLFKGIVCYCNIRLPFQTHTFDGYVHSLASSSESGLVQSKFLIRKYQQLNISNQSFFGKRQLLNSLSCSDDITILKTTKGIPFIKTKYHKQNYEISISHHGKYIATAILTIPNPGDYA